jgi:membrane dipeptidase
MFLVDAHCDTITALLATNQPLAANNAHVCLEKLKPFGQAVQFFAVWLDDKLASSGYANTMAAIEFFKGEVQKNAKHIAIVHDHSDVQTNVATNKISALITIEGGEALEGDIRNLYRLYAAGARSLTLLWNRPNAIGDPSALPKAQGLTAFGKAVVREMEALRMIVDVSHLSIKGFFDVAELSTKPFIASHSNARAKCTHTRNLLDDQIIALRDAGGVMGLNMYPTFLNDSGQAAKTDILRHIDHVLELAGDKCIGLGGDYDGICATPADMPNVSAYHDLYTDLCTNFGNETADNIFGGNFLRVIKNVL